MNKHGKIAEHPSLHIGASHRPRRENKLNDSSRFGGGSSGFRRHAWNPDEVTGNPDEVTGNPDEVTGTCVCLRVAVHAEEQDAAFLFLALTVRACIRCRLSLFAPYPVCPRCI
eukprot:1001554-Prorocentrum_minimum.AAC.1